MDGWNDAQQSKPRPRFKETASSEEEPMTSVCGSSKKEQVQASSKSGGAPGLASSSLNKKFRKSSQGGGKPSFLTGRGIASATRFLNYRFLSLQTSGNNLIPADSAPLFSYDLTTFSTQLDYF